MLIIFLVLISLNSHKPVQNIANVLVTEAAIAKECQKRDYGNGGHVCVCNSSYCDTVPKVERINQPYYRKYTSNKAGLRLRKSEGIFTVNNETFQNQIFVDTKNKYQDILGWGGSFTDSTGLNIASLDTQTQEKLLKAYFSADGIEYTLCRVPMGGTDFSPRDYSYADGSADPKLTNFQLAPEDFLYKVPFIRKAQELTNGKLQLIASAWTAPKWMKTNNKYGGFGFLRKNMYQAWAEYFVKFLDKYENEGIRFWGLTTGNEPSMGFFPISMINSVAWTPTMMGKWVRQNLGPSLRNSSHTETKIIILDDLKCLLPWFVNIAMEHQTSRSYVDGIAVHSYLDAFFPASLLNRTHDNFPGKFLLMTETCNGMLPWDEPVVLGSWHRGESYANSIIKDVRNWVGGWVDWNMALDVTGGPSNINHSVDSPIIVNSTAGEFYKQPMFYNLGHFSKFVPIGSVRVDSFTFNKKIPVVAFQRPDGGTVVVILNKINKAVPITLVDDSRGSTQIDLSEKSITTILYW